MKIKSMIKRFGSAVDSHWDEAALWIVGGVALCAAFYGLYRINLAIGGPKWYEVFVWIVCVLIYILISVICTRSNEEVKKPKKDENK
ncbi:MAG: hypothetical protein WCV55_03710 [Candidatus Paceibacterota bacterium]